MKQPDDYYRMKYALLPIDVQKFKEPVEGDICRFCGEGIAQHTIGSLQICLAGFSGYNVDDVIHRPSVGNWEKCGRHWQTKLEECQ